MASNLRRNGIKPGEVVCIYMDKTDQYIMAILAILKCGCTYLPLDKLYPMTRIERMMAIGDSKCLIVDEEKSVRKSWSCNTSILSIHALLENGEVEQESTDTFPNIQQLAYIIFTSGSTGDPKGIGIRQKSVINLVEALQQEIKNDETIARVGLVASMVFDMSVAQMYYALLSGKTLVVVPDELKRMPGELINYLNAKAIELCDITPQHLHVLVKYIRYQENQQRLPEVLIVAGEALPLNVVKEYYALQHTKKSIVINSYGPAEACVYVSFYSIRKSTAEQMEQMYIGKPMQNTQIYILDDEGKLCQVGQAGELCIVGEGVAIGYVNNPRLTSEKFVPNPFNKDEVMYRTGDWAKWSSIGEIICLGRRDDQVKIRGFRIELEEIEHQIDQFVGVEQSKVILDNSENHAILVAYFISKQEVHLEQLLEHLKRYLPEYMIPQHFVRVETFKTTINGKIDKQQLPDYTLCAINKKHKILGDEVLSELEEKVIRFCQDLLMIKKITLEDDLIGLGADSLKFIQLGIEVNQAWSIQLNFADLYSCQTVRNLCELIQSYLDAKEVEGITTQHTSSYEKAKAYDFQKLIFKFDKREDMKRMKLQLPRRPSYNIIHYIKANQWIDADRFKGALEQVVRTQCAFRMHFSYKVPEYEIEVDKGCEGYFEVIECEGALTPEYIKTYAKHFTINQLPLFQVCLFQNDKQEQVILFNIHHAVFDYYSMHIFLGELLKAYVGEQLENPSMKYIEYINSWEKKLKTSYISFWRDYFANRKEAAVFPPRQTILTLKLEKTEHFSEQSYEIVGARLEKVRAVCRALRLSEYVLFSTVYALLLASESKCNDVILGTYLPDRNKDNSRLIGLFTHMVGIRFKFDFSQSIQEMFKQQSEQFRQVMKHQCLEHTDIYKALGTADLFKGELFRTVFNYVFSPKETKGELTLTADEIGDEPEQWPLCLKAFDNVEQLEFKFKYASRMYTPQYIEYLYEKYMLYIDQVLEISEKEKCIKDILRKANERYPDDTKTSFSL